MWWIFNQKPKNYGVIEGQRNTDYIAGTLPYEIRNPSGNWEQYLPTGEKQYNRNMDTMACVSFSALNSIEVQYKFLTGEEINLSDRFTATMSGTMKEGNYLWKVADSIRKDGVIEEDLWPAPVNYSWDSYYSAITIDIINEAKEFLNDWEVKYEFIDFSRDSLMYHLKQAPIQIVKPGHAILDFFTTQDVVKYFDSYEPFKKDYTGLLRSACKIVLTKKENMLTKENIRFLQALEGFEDQEGVDFWGNGTHTLDEYKKARVPHKIKELEKLK